MATIRITDLVLRTIIGANEWERDIKQEVIINITIEFDARKASATDNLKDTIDYKALTKKIIKAIEPSSFFLVEKLAATVLKIVMQDKKIKAATVRVDKPHALRFAKSVSIELTDTRK